MLAWNHTNNTEIEFWVEQVVAWSADRRAHDAQLESKPPNIQATGSCRGARPSM